MELLLTCFLFTHELLDGTCLPGYAVDRQSSENMIDERAPMAYYYTRIGNS